MIFQEPMSSLNPVFTVGFQLGEVLREHLGLSRSRRASARSSCCDEVGIPEPEAKLDRYPFQLSGGQQQRVMIAMAIACEPKLLIADEPTTALDVTVQKQILELIAELQRRRRMSMLFITHDLALVRQVADHVVVMREGEIREQGSVAQVFGSPRDDYTRMLLDARPQDGSARQASSFQAEVILEARGLAKSFDGVSGGEGRELQARQGQDARPGRRIRLGQDDARPAGDRLHEASGGELRFDGEDLRAVPRARLQAPHPDRVPESLRLAQSALQHRPDPDRADAHPRHRRGRRRSAVRSPPALLAKVGLPESAFFKYPHEFSGGQRQRIAIARALAAEARGR